MIVILILLMNTDVIKDGPEANKCFAILIFSMMLWASEVSRRHVSHDVLVDGV